MNEKELTDLAHRIHQWGKHGKPVGPADDPCVRCGGFTFQAPDSRTPLCNDCAHATAGDFAALLVEPPARGQEAEELRSGVERLIRDYRGQPKKGILKALQKLLDGVDARDSLAHLEASEEKL